MSFHLPQEYSCNRIERINQFALPCRVGANKATLSLWSSFQASFHPHTPCGVQ